MKKVISDNMQDTINVNDCSEDKIYCCTCANKNYYKLSRISNNHYAFINLDISNGLYNNTGNFADIIERALITAQDVFEFNNINEFANWLNARIN